jgi:hypothetical protein
VNEPSASAAVETALREHFGRVPARASVSFVGVEPIEVLRFEVSPGEWTFVSLGMARRPMTPANQVVQAADGPRAELVLELADPAGAYPDAWRSLALLAAAPAVEGVVYRAGMSVDLGAALAPGSRCTGVLVTDAELPAVGTPAGEVALLRVVPATAGELAWCRVQGSAALQQRWHAQGVPLRDLGRRPADLG